MTNYFNLNFGFPFGMNNWFVPTFSFQNLFSSFEMQFFNNNYFNLFSAYQYPFNNSIFSFNQNTYMGNIDTFQRTKKSSGVESMSSNINFSKDNLKLDDYNSFKGERLAKIALNNTRGWTGWCATYVKNAIQQAGLGAYVKGNAYQMTGILKNNRNFKEISPDGIDVSKLPAGCVLVYDKGVSGYSKKYGHTEITTGDGRAVSDGITKHLSKKPTSIFIPV